MNQSQKKKRKRELNPAIKKEKLLKIRVLQLVAQLDMDSKLKVSIETT